MARRPCNTELIPSFLILVQLSWVSTFQGLIVPHWGQGLGISMIRQYMLSIPDELIDAAKIDGASEPSIEHLRTHRRAPVGADAHLVGPARDDVDLERHRLAADRH